MVGGVWTGDDYDCRLYRSGDLGHTWQREIVSESIFRAFMSQIQR